MAERPILFSAPMVRAILNGRKTQTRRVLKPQPVLNDAGLWVWPPNWTGPLLKKWGRAVQCDEDGLRMTFESDRVKAALPYAIGDIMWVRERLAEGADGTVVYPADGYVHPDAEWVWQRKHLPSIHCPRGLSRITLKVTGVKVELLQDISEKDAEAEGVEPKFAAGWPSREHIGGFYQIWANIHSPDSWASNPWVVAVTFERAPVNAIKEAPSHD